MLYIYVHGHVNKHLSHHIFAEAVFYVMYDVP